MLLSSSQIANILSFSYVPLKRWNSKMVLGSESITADIQPLICYCYSAAGPIEFLVSGETSGYLVGDLAIVMSLNVK